MKIYVCKITLFCPHRQSLGKNSVTFASEFKQKQGHPDVNRYFIYLGYNGKKFCGWQIQPNGITVQQSIEEALATLLRQPVPIVGAGRTDAGVHARLMVAHFDWKEPIDDLVFLVEKLNRLLPKDIAVYRIVLFVPMRMLGSMPLRVLINIISRHEKIRSTMNWSIKFRENSTSRQ